MMIPNRRSIRLAGYDYADAGLYFLTICVNDKKQAIFGKIENNVALLNNIGRIAERCWLEIPQHFKNVVLHEYVIMPNHIHGIIELVGANNHSPENDNRQNSHENIKKWGNIAGEKCFAPAGTSRTIGSIVRGFKIGVTKQLGYSIWQRNYFEHIVRSADDYIRISTYIAQNPQKWADKQLIK